MIPKITTPNNAPFTLVASLKAEILYYAAMGVNISLQNIKLSHEYVGYVHVKPKNIELEYDDNKIALFCSPKWIRVMCALNNISLNAIKIILQVFTKCSSRLLIIIYAVLSISHYDIMSMLLRIIFNEKYFNMCDVYTFVNDGELLLCYSKYFEEYNPFNILNYFTYHFDNMRKIIGEKDEIVRTICICNAYWLTDPELQLNLVYVNNSNTIIFVGKINYVEGSIFAYAIEVNLNYYGPDKDQMIIGLIKSYKGDTPFGRLRKIMSNVDPENIQSHHKIVNGEWC